MASASLRATAAMNSRTTGAGRLPAVAAPATGAVGGGSDAQECLVAERDAEGEPGEHQGEPQQRG